MAKREDIQCGYLTLPDSGAQIHYRTAGDGPPLLLLHPSPQSSEALEPAILAFSEVCTCIAIDTPGYGQSDDPLPDGATLNDYGDLVFSVADSLGLERFFLYGAATGAQIAIEMGKHRPERLALVLLDANGHIDKEERERLTNGYFAPVTPRRDGGHLLTLWDMCSRLFSNFPWNSDDPANRLPIPRMPPEFVHATLLRYLDAGENYAKAYRFAFEAEDIAHFDGFAAPGVMTRWQGSAVLRIADDLIAQGLPANVRVLYAGPTLPERYSVQVDALRQAISAQAENTAKPQLAKTSDGLHRAYVETPHGQLHIASNNLGEGDLVVLLHKAGGAHCDFADAIADLSGRQPFIAFDLPGHGHSRVQVDDFSDIGSYTMPLLAALQGYDKPLHLVGEGLGGLLALQLASELSNCQVTIQDPVLRNAEERSGVSVPAPDLSPKDSGSHLVDAWHFAREESLRIPWYDGAVSAQRAVPTSQDPDYLHARVSKILRLGSGFGKALSLESNANWETLLADVKAPCAIAITPTYPLPNCIPPLEALGYAVLHCPNVAAAILPRS